MQSSVDREEEGIQHTSEIAQSIRRMEVKVPLMVQELPLTRQRMFTGLRKLKNHRRNVATWMGQERPLANARSRSVDREERLRSGRARTELLLSLQLRRIQPSLRSSTLQPR